MKVPFFRCLYVFGDVHFENFGLGVCAPLRVGLRTSAHWKPFALPLTALKVKVSEWFLPDFALRSLAFGADGVGCVGPIAAGATVPVAFEVAAAPDPKALDAVSMTRIVDPTSPEVRVYVCAVCPESTWQLPPPTAQRSH